MTPDLPFHQSESVRVTFRRSELHTILVFCESALDSVETDEDLEHYRRIATKAEKALERP
jgi:hypothetical protein